MLNRKKLGFSLVELVLCLGLLAMLGGLATAGYAKLQEISLKEKLSLDADTINKVIRTYETTTQAIPNDITLEEVITLYLRPQLSEKTFREKVAIGGAVNANQIEVVTEGVALSYVNGVVGVSTSGGYRFTSGVADPVATTTDVAVSKLRMNKEDSGWVWDADAAPIASVSAEPITYLETLNAPRFLITGSVRISDFPISGTLMQAPNPVGTVLRYTTDGSDPVDASPVWNNPSITLPSLTGSPIKVRAFHSDTKYTPSEIAQATILVRAEIQYARVDGTNALSFEFDEVNNASNGIVLTSPGAPTGDYQIRYTIDGSDPTSTSTLYTGIINIPLIDWEANGKNLKAKVFMFNAAFADSNIFDRQLSTIKEQLAPPVFSNITGGVAYAHSFSVIANTSDSVEGRVLGNGEGFTIANSTSREAPFVLQDPSRL